MAHSSRTSSEQLRLKRALNATIEDLEKREVLAPFISTQSYSASFTAATTPTFSNLGTVSITATNSTTSAAGFTSVTELTSLNQFGGDIVRIQAGPGGDFGQGLYAISRGAGSNTSAVNRPGTIYRVDTATGNASVFVDLQSVIQKLTNDPTATAASNVSTSSGLVNWYDITFDSEGYFFGRSAMLVSMADSTDATKNAVYAFGSDGSLIGALVTMNEQSTVNQLFTRTPTAVLVPPAEYQVRARGLFTGTGTKDTSGDYTALFFDANSYSPGQALNSATLPPGVFNTNLTWGPQVGLTASNNLANYNFQIFSAFTDLSTGSSGGLPGIPGWSGIDGNTNGLFIRPNYTGVMPAEIFTSATGVSLPAGTNVDSFMVAQTPFRRFQDIAFDSYGYFSYGSTVTPATGTTTAPAYVGSMFVTDMGNGMAVSGTATIGGVAYTFYAPVNNSGSTLSYNTTTNQFVDNGSNYTGGRLLRVAPDGTVSTFAENFNVSEVRDQSSFVNSSFSVTFSSDGTKMWVSDDDGIWQFASTLSLAGSTTGNVIGLNDLRTLATPYNGQNSAVAVLDTGVDANNTSFRGRVARGTNVNRRRGGGNIDTSGTGTGTAGHGTPVAGIVSQMVPQATIMPVNLFIAGAIPGSIGGGSTTTAALGYTSNQSIFKALQYLRRNPYVADPIRPGQKDRVIASTMAWGTQTSFPTEGQAFEAYPQIVASFKQQLNRIRRLGITTVAAAGQFGTPQGGTGTTTTTATTGDFDGMSMPAVLNEVVSAGMTTAMPMYLTPNTEPTDPTVGPYPRAWIPIQFRTATTTTTAGIGTGQVATMTNANPNLYSDDILYSSNSSITTDYMAPGVDVPTFAQTVGGTNNPMVFDQAGTSMSTAVTTGSFAIVSSALNYWVGMSRGGATSDAYLTQPVGVNTLNFGKNTLKDLSLYANPDGVNSILQWTAVPVSYNELNSLTTSTPAAGQSFSRIDVGNAVASIEGEVAMQYLVKNDMLTVIDSNKNGAITASELQNFVDNASAMGLSEAGAMARLLGGITTFDSGATEYETKSTFATQLNDVPDPAGALSRRFNYFDYAANGELKGYLTYDQIKALSQTLLPSPTSFVITDRTRSSANAYLLDPEAIRNYNEITKLNYSWVYASGPNLKKYRGYSPAMFGVNKGLNDRTDPGYVLFDGPPPIKAAAKSSSAAATKTTETAATTPVTTASTTPATGTQSTSTTGSTSTSGTTATDNSAALLAALQNIVKQGSAQSGSTSSSVVTSTVNAAGSTTNTTGSVQGAAAMNRKRPNVATSTKKVQTTSPVTHTAQTKNTFSSLADKLGLGKFF